MITMRFALSTAFAVGFFLGLTNAQVVEDKAARRMQELIAWIRSSEDGYLNDNLEIRRTDPSNGISSFGMFATSDIDANEELLYLPEDCLLRLEEDELEINYVDDLAGLASFVAEEMALGDESEYAPFLNYLKTQKEGHIPSAWSKHGKELLQTLVGYNYDVDPDNTMPLSRFPPNHLFNFDQASCFWQFGIRQKCIRTPKEKLAGSLIKQRSDYKTLSPLYDMINHKSEVVDTITAVSDEEGILLKASKNIKAGDEIVHDYRDCLACDEKFEAELSGTAEILRDFGFVDSYPQKWYFDKNISFALTQVTTQDHTSTTLELSWIDGKMPQNSSQVEWLDELYQYLMDVQKYDMEDAAKKDLIPKYEMDVIIQYHQTLLTAVEMAIKASDEYRNVCLNDACNSPMNAVERAVDELDDFYSKIYQCETLTYHADKYDTQETVLSQYQRLDYKEHRETKNACFYLDGIFQICESYWPHYHEMFVHKPAKYIARDVKRLLWVGGGDSGLVNEIVKYPDLELAVGLELDQKVTRGAFKYFGAEPHFNNEKVQWWFGDASKSLLMLPTEYFGSFDMVMVDLSDTVLAFSVSKTLDIFSALSLLLKPDGLLVMNELFFKRVSDVFKYTINLSFTGVPEIDDQHYVIGSNSIDFLKSALVDHDLNGDIYVENSIYKTKHQFDMVHDYRHNIDNAFKKLCKTDGTDDDDDMEEQEASPGILMIIEAENLSADLSSITDIQSSVVKALEKEGLNLITASALPPSDSAYDSEATNFVLILRQGYVVVRTFPEHKHCSFDLHLWSEFNKHNAAKKALIASVGGSMDSVTSYRIVAGGMFGVSTWQDDVKSRGPKVTQKCEDSLDSSSSAVLKKDPESVAIALKAGISLVQEKNARVAVVCGYETDSCDSIGVLEKEGNVGEVLPLYTCPGLANDVQSFEDRQNVFFNCKESISKTLHDSFSGNENALHAIVLDRGVPKEMGDVLGQTLYRIFRGRNAAPQAIFSDRVAVITTVEDESEEWRRKLLNTVREHIIVRDPISGARVFFNNSDSSIELHITSSGDEMFLDHLTNCVSNVERDTGLTLEIRNVLGGHWKPELASIVHPSDTLQYMSTGDYNHSSALKQWKSQQPLGYQTVFQLEQSRHYEIGDKVYAFYQDYPEQRVTEIIWKDTVNDYYGVRFHWGVEQTMPGALIRPVDETPKPLPTMTASDIDDALKETLASLRVFQVTNPVLYRLDSVGDGTISVVLWSGGTIVVVWDGRKHVDINMFTYDDEHKYADEFVLLFKQSQGSFVTSLRDEQPRGTGHVLNFLDDLDDDVTPRANPRWA